MSPRAASARHLLARRPAHSPRNTPRTRSAAPAARGASRALDTEVRREAAWNTKGGTWSAARPPASARARSSRRHRRAPGRAGRGRGPAAVPGRRGRLGASAREDPLGPTRGACREGRSGGRWRRASRHRDRAACIDGSRPRQRVAGPVRRRRPRQHRRAPTSIDGLRRATASGRSRAPTTPTTWSSRGAWNWSSATATAATRMGLGTCPWAGRPMTVTASEPSASSDRATARRAATSWADIGGL